MKKIFSFLFAIVFLLTLVSFFPPKFAFADCSPKCAASQTCVAGVLGGYSCSGPTCAQACSSANKTCGTASGCNCGSCSSGTVCTALATGGNRCQALPCTTQCANANKTCGTAGSCYCGNGTANSGCPTGQICNAIVTGGTHCENPTCAQQCAAASKTCGTQNGCICGSGTTNGGCPVGQTCTAAVLGGANCQVTACAVQCAAVSKTCGTIGAGSTACDCGVCATGSICTAEVLGGASCTKQYPSCNSQCAGEGLQCGTVSGCTDDAGAIIPAGVASDQAYFCPVNTLRTNSGCPTGQTCTAIPTGGAHCQGGGSTPTPPGGGTNPNPPTEPAHTKISFRIGLDGIGITGDRPNPSHYLPVVNAKGVTVGAGSNFAVKHNPRAFTIIINNVPYKNVSFTFDNTKTDTYYGLYTGAIDLGTTFKTGDYPIVATTEGHLNKKFPANVHIIGGNLTNSATLDHMVTGDVTGAGTGTLSVLTASSSGIQTAGTVDITSATPDNKLTIYDYTVLMSCLKDSDINDFDNGVTCKKDGKNGVDFTRRSDLEDNGVVDKYDYNLFVREFSMIQQGD
jgi:hypothetical protein